MKPSASYNVHSYSLYFLEHQRKTNPRALVMMNDHGAAVTIKRALPNTLVIFRLWGSDGDENDYLQYDPREWLDRMKQYAVEGIALYCLNEPPFNKQVIDWLKDVCTINLEPNYQFVLVLGNFATGNPKPEEWPLAKDLLTLMAQRPDLFILGLHQYCGAVVTSGLYGGYPDNAGVEPGKPGGKNLIPPANWPKDTSGVTKFHLGRETFLVAYCRENEVAVPRIIVTEGIFDDTSDIDVWLKRLPVSSPYLNVRGFKTLRYQWSRWFPDWSVDRAYFEQLKYALEVIWKDSPVEAVCLFSWGHSSSSWEQFDLSGELEFHKLLEDYIAASDAAPVPLPEPAPVINIQPTDPRFGNDVILKTTGATSHLRERPNITAPIVIKFVAETVKYIPLGLLIENEKLFDLIGTDRRAYWLSVLHGGRVLWVRDDAVEILPVPTQPPPPPPPPHEPPVDDAPNEEADDTPSAPSEEELLLIELRRAWASVGEACNKLAIASARYSDYLKKRETEIRERRLAA